MLDTATLNEMISTALDLDDASGLEWRRDPDNEDGWVAEWIYNEPINEVARYLRSQYSVDASVSHTGPMDGKQPSSWLWIKPLGSR